MLYLYMNHMELSTMKIKLTFIGIINLFCNYAIALSNTTLHILYDAGRHQEAISQAKNYLQFHRDDGDVRLALAQFYFKEENYQQARTELLTILEQTPNYIDALLILINCDIALDNYQEALFIASYGLLLNPIDPDLYKKKSDSESLNIAFNPPYQAGIVPPQNLETRLVTIHFSPSATRPVTYEYLKTLYEQGKHQLAIHEAELYLEKYPNDADVRLVLGQFYFEQRAYTKAKEEVRQVLQQVPKYKDAILILINIDIKLKQFKEAIILAKQGLLYYPQNKMLQKKLQDIKNSQHPPALPSQPVKSQPENPQYSNEVGLYQQNYYISDVHQTWDYSTLYFAHDTKLAKIYGKINYNKRLDFEAFQGELEAFLKLTKRIYLELQTAFANESNLFPDQLYGGELYVSVPKFIDFSGGGKYNFINSQHQLALYTGSLSKLFGKHSLTYRFNYYDPNAGKTSLLNLADYRYFIRDPNVYIGIIYGQGTSPDLANLNTVDFLVTNNKLFSPYLNFALFKTRLIVNTSFYYQNQIFESLSRVRKWTGGTIRLAWKFK